MRNLLTIAAAIAAASLAACNSPQDQAAQVQADAQESQAAATSNEQLETELNARADAIEQQAGNADGGATTANTPDTSPSQ
jgi:predicted small secreted protein